MPYTQNNWFEPEDIQRMIPAAAMVGMLGAFGAARLGLFKPLGLAFRGAGKATSALGRFAFSPQIMMEEYGASGASAFLGPSRAGVAARAFGRFALGKSADISRSTILTAAKTPLRTLHATKWGTKSLIGLGGGVVKLGEGGLRVGTALMETIGKHPILFGGLAVGGAIVAGATTSLSNFGGLPRGGYQSLDFYGQSGRRGKRMSSDNLGATGDLVFGLHRNR